ncbi:hypothetical protein BGZ83_004330, partial [Gryganskiella cystojenkinii]
LSIPFTKTLTASSPSSPLSTTALLASLSMVALKATLSVDLSVGPITSISTLTAKRYPYYSLTAPALWPMASLHLSSLVKTTSTTSLPLSMTSPNMTLFSVNRGSLLSTLLSTIAPTSSPFTTRAFSTAGTALVTLLLPTMPHNTPRNPASSLPSTFSNSPNKTLTPSSSLFTLIKPHPHLLPPSPPIPLSLILNPPPLPPSNPPPTQKSLMPSDTLSKLSSLMFSQTTSPTASLLTV